MAALTQQQKVFIVGRLACYYRPSDVRKQLKEELGVDATLQQISFYDPGTAQGNRELSAELRQVFQETRDLFLRDVTRIPIANKAVRLRMLDDMARDNARNPRLVKELIEQAAKEDGGAFTNRRELTGKDGKPIEANVGLSFEAAVMLLRKGGADADDGGADPGL